MPKKFVNLRIMKFEESNTQIACFEFFALAYPKLRPLFFAVPNGGNRNLREAARMKREGVTAGVADALLLVSRGPYHGLAVEFKTATGRQSPEQKKFQAAAEQQDYKYEICRNFDNFRVIVENYLSLPQMTLK